MITINDAYSIMIWVLCVAVAGVIAAYVKGGIDERRRIEQLFDEEETERTSAS